MHRSNTASSFDHFVGARGEPGRHVEPKRFRGLEVDQEFEFGGLIDRQVGGRGAIENASHVDSGAAISICRIVAIAHQPPSSTNSRLVYIAGTASRAAKATICCR